MSLRSLFAALATAWFVYLAMTYMAPGTYLTSDPGIEPGNGYLEILGGSDIGLAMTSAVRAIAVGLALVSAAAIEWSAVVAAYRASEARRRAELVGQATIPAADPDAAQAAG